MDARYGMPLLGKLTMAKKQKQETMGDMVPVIEEVCLAMERYKTARDRRMAQTEEEVGAKNMLIDLMKKHDLVIYKANGQMVTLEHVEKDDVKVKSIEVDGKGIDE